MALIVKPRKKQTRQPVSRAYSVSGSFRTPNTAASAGVICTECGMAFLFAGSGKCPRCGSRKNEKTGKSG